MLDQFGMHRRGGVDVGGKVDLAESFLDAVGQCDFAAGIGQLQSRCQPLGGFDGEAFLARSVAPCNPGSYLDDVAQPGGLHGDGHSAPSRSE